VLLQQSKIEFASNTSSHLLIVATTQKEITIKWKSTKITAIFALVDLLTFE
jgi:hypothetical protein